MNDKALFKLTSGLFLVTAKTNKDNGCIINTVLQVTASPVRIVIAINNKNYTHDMVKETGLFNISVLSETAPMDLYKRFGYISEGILINLAVIEGQHIQIMVVCTLQNIVMHIYQARL